MGHIRPPHLAVVVKESPIGRPILKAGWQPPSSTNGTDGSAHIGARDCGGVVSNGAVKVQKGLRKRPPTTPLEDWITYHKQAQVLASCACCSTPLRYQEELSLTFTLRDAALLGGASAPPFI